MDYSRLEFFISKPRMDKFLSAVMNSELNRIRSFRNRIYHNEPICFSGYCVNFDLATTIQKEIYEVLQWMDQDLAAYVRHFDDIDAELARLIELQ